MPPEKRRPPFTLVSLTSNSCAQSLCNLIRFAIRLDYLIECGVVSALVRLADPGDEATSECCAAALYLFFCHPDVLALIDGREVGRQDEGKKPLMTFGFGVMFLEWIIGYTLCERWRPSLSKNAIRSIRSRFMSAAGMLSGHQGVDGPVPRRYHKHPKALRGGDLEHDQRGAGGARWWQRS